MRENKVRLDLMVLPSVKETLFANARAENLSVSAYVQRLVSGHPAHSHDYAEKLAELDGRMRNVEAVTAVMLDRMGGEV